MKQNAELRIKLTTEQLNKIKKQSDKLGFTIKEFVLYVCLNSEIKISIKARE